MRIRSLLSLTIVIFFLAYPLPTCVASSGQSCVILVRNDPGLLQRQAEKLHQLIDLLPDNYRLGLGFCGQHDFLAPEPLTMQYRIRLHQALHRGLSAEEYTEREWLQLTNQALKQFGTGSSAREKQLVVIQSDNESPAGWPQFAAALDEQHVRTVVLTERNGSPPPALSIHNRGQQWSIKGDLLPVLAQQLGLGRGDLLLQVMGQDRYVQRFFLDEAVEGFVLLVQNVLPDSLQLLNPSGQPLTEEGGLTYCLQANGYVSMHVAKDNVSGLNWAGEWQLITPAQAESSLWLVDPVRIEGAVTLGPTGRLVSASLWRGGDRLKTPAAAGGRVLLRDGAHRELALLNDAGLNGDAVAGDGIFTVCLPDFLHPLAGPALLEVDDYIYRSVLLALPGSASVPLPLRANASVLQVPWALAAMLVGAGGLTMCLRPLPGQWKVRHHAANGYWHSIYYRGRVLYAGSARTCPLRLSAAAGKRHMRFTADANCHLSLEVLQAEPATLVNGERVYLRCELQHGDEIQVAGDTLLVEHLANLRSGRRRLCQQGRDSAMDGQSDR